MENSTNSAAARGARRVRVSPPSPSEVRPFMPVAVRPRLIASLLAYRWRGRRCPTPACPPRAYHTVRTWRPGSWNWGRWRSEQADPGAGGRRRSARSGPTVFDPGGAVDRQEAGGRADRAYSRSNCVPRGFTWDVSKWAPAGAVRPVVGAGPPMEALSEGRQRGVERRQPEAVHLCLMAAILPRIRRTFQYLLAGLGPPVGPPGVARSSGADRTGGLRVRIRHDERVEASAMPSEAEPGSHPQPQGPGAGVENPVFWATKATASPPLPESSVLPLSPLSLQPPRPHSPGAAAPTANSTPVRLNNSPAPGRWAGGGPPSGGSRSGAPRPAPPPRKQPRRTPGASG